MIKDEPVVSMTNSLCHALTNSWQLVTNSWSRRWKRQAGYGEDAIAAEDATDADVVDDGDEVSAAGDLFLWGSQWACD